MPLLPQSTRPDSLTHEPKNRYCNHNANRVGGILPPAYLAFLIHAT